MNKDNHSESSSQGVSQEQSRDKKPEGMFSHDSLSALSDAQLKKLANQAKKATAGRPPEKERLEYMKKRRRYWHKRFFIWFLEFCVLLAVLEIFILEPRRTEREAMRRQAEERALTPPGRGAELEEMGDQAISLTALREVTPAYRVALEKLADGSEEAQRRQEAYAADKGLPVEVENSIGMRFRLVPPGSFLQGSPEDERGRWEGEIQHSAAVSEPIYVGKFEVTQEQWQKVMDTSPAYFSGARRPVETVTWHEAQEFTRKLAEKEGVEQGTYRLPVETEWEYACRAGTQSAYVFGDDPAGLEEFAFFDRNSYGRTNEVGQLHPNAFGLHDMHGNVWEWCEDAFADYPGFVSERVSDGFGTYDPTDGRWYNVRGGNFRDQARDCRSASRTRLPPDSHGNLLGFRVVRTIPEVE